MNLNQIDLQGYILALFIRDDGERFLLGSGYYEFVEKQLHFKANEFQNDIVEVQGNDGLLLAGQVRRATSQDFDGYVGDNTVSRAEIENKRRAFLAFFRKNYYYTVVYIFHDGTAIQRKKGFIVDAPEVQEIYQFIPKYHISLNFEDVNYYAYAEDSDGHEVYGKSATIPLTTGVLDGGLIWENSKNLLPSDGLVIYQVVADLLVIEPIYVDNKLKRIEADGYSSNETHYTIGAMNFKKDEIYTFSGVTGGSSSTYGLYISPCEAFPTGVALYSSSKTITAAADSYNVEVYFLMKAGTVANSAMIYPQIELGDTATAYEPYQVKKGAEWDNVGAIWEAGSGGGGPSIVQVDSIDNVYPIWEVKGPAENPRLDVLTTNTTIRYSGNVMAGQTLVIDMFNKTAFLNGTSVVMNLSGGWIYLKSGNNRITYLTGNNDATASTIYWQEVIG